MKWKFTILILATLLLALPVWAQDGSKGAISTTAHNLAGAGQEVCAFCHIPHQLAANSRTLMWNHSAGTSTTYTPYSSATLNSTPTQLDQTSPTQQQGVEFYSLSCMSCHDGLTATNVLYRVPGTAAGGTYGTGAVITGGDSLGIDLSNDHPVNMAYTDAIALADKGLWATPDGGFSIGTGIRTVRSTDTTWGTTGIQSPVLFSTTVQCATCHNPHNNTNGTFLRIANTNSALCLKCHSTT